MGGRQEDFLKKLLEEFRVEGEEHHKAIVDGLMELDSGPGADRTMEVIEGVFREIHSLKGAARAVNLLDIEKLCQGAENIFSFLKREEFQYNADLSDMLHTFANIIDMLIKRSDSPLTTEESCTVAKMINLMNRAAKGDELECVPVIQFNNIQEKSDVNETVRITTTKLTDLFLQAEELIITKLKWGQYVKELREVSSRIELLRKSSEKNFFNNNFDNVVYLNSCADEALQFQNLKLKEIEIEIQGLNNKIDQEFRNLGRVVDGLLADMKKSFMFPVSSIFDIMPKLVRDLCRDKGKSAELVVHGGEIEVDRRVLEEIKDPLIHIIRNCVDYGIEMPEVRLQRGKERTGTILVEVRKKDTREVEIIISDDGGGIDLEGVVSAALRSGVITGETAENITHEETLNLLLQSGVSTSPIITDISGRGIGLAIVQEKAEKLGGTVSIESSQGKGTLFRIALPLTQASFRGVVVKTGDHVFIIPIQCVERVIRISRNSIGTVENRETVSVDDEVLPLLPLADVLKVKPKSDASDRDGLLPVVILSYSRKRIAFSVDEVSGEQEGIIKSLGPQLTGLNNFAGATISGTGEIIPVIEVADLINSAINFNTGEQHHRHEEDEEKAVHTVLVAEDSVTARSLLKNIIQSGGYVVETAVDGVDALTSLRGGDFDLLVSDVDMPRLNGFELTEKIRGDSRLTSLPVILVTSLDSREDRERGIDAGANAYIIKSSFEQSNLLDVIRRLI